MAKTTVTITPAAPIPQHQKTSNHCVSLHLSPHQNSHLSGSNSSNNSAITSIIPSSDYSKLIKNDLLKQQLEQVIYDLNLLFEIFRFKLR